MEDNKIQESSQIFSVNILYMIINILFLSLGAYFQKREIFSGLLITQYILLLIPGIIYLNIKKMPIRESLRLNPISFKDGFKIILIAIFLYPIMVLFQGIFIGLINLIRQTILPTTVPMPENSYEFIRGLFIIAISPGICEEIIFRGIILNEYRKEGIVFGIIVSGFLFGIMHMTLLNFIGPFIMGIIFGILVERTNSLYASMIGHMTNNTIALSLGYMMNKWNISTSDRPTDIISLEQVLEGLNALLIVIIICAFLVCILIRSVGEEEIEEDIVVKDYSENIFLRYSPIIVVIIIFIYRNLKYVFI